MFQSDSSHQHDRSDVQPTFDALPSATKPPVLPPPPGPAPKRKRWPWVIAAVGFAGFAALVTAGIIAASLFGTRMVTETHAAEARESSIRETKAREITLAQAKPGSASAASEPGVSYTNVTVASVPWSLHVLKVDRSRKDLALVSAHAGNKVLGVSLIRDMARAVPREWGRAIAGVNGDFYDRDDPRYAGDPRGLQIIDGELISAPDTVCVWFDADGNPHLDELKGLFYVTWPDGRKTRFGLNQRRRSGLPVLYTPTYGPSTRANGGRELILEKDGDGPWLPFQAGQTYRARVREISTTGNTRLAGDIMVLSLPPDQLAKLPGAPPGTVVQISTTTTPDLKGVKMAIAGGPAIIKNGKPFALRNPPPGASGSYSEASKYQRHPRSALGWSPTHVYLVTADGRQPGLSVGMTLAELAEFMVKLGCTDAMNLDGGKSAQMWMNGRIMNSPHQGEDTVANSLLVVRKAEGR